MKLSDFVVREAIVVDLQATGKEEAIRKIVRSLSHSGRLTESDLESVTRAILGREELGSTGIGQGVAVPHTRHPTVSRLIGTVALNRAPLGVVGQQRGEARSERPRMRFGLSRRRKRTARPR